jgi:nitroreductase
LVVGARQARCRRLFRVDQLGRTEVAMRTRRGLLILGTGVAAVGAGLAYRAWDRGVGSAFSGSAYAPWRGWDGDAGDGLKRPLRAAILAANPHNTQPWLFKLAENEITIFADRGRNLGSFDPFRREMHLGLGAATENLVLAARAFGLAAQVTPATGTLSPSPTDAPIPAVNIALSPAPPARDALVGAIAVRHTSRGAYRADKAIDAETLRRLRDLVSSEAVQLAYVQDRGARGELGALIVEATERIITDPEMSADSARWFRGGRRDIAAHRDGITVDTAGLSPVMTVAAKLLPDADATTADQYWLATTRENQVPTAPLLGVLMVRDRLDMAAAIEAGRAWQRLHLAATLAGLAAQPLNQPVECIDRNAILGRPDSFMTGLAKLAGVTDWEPTFVFRLGFAERAAGPSPRRALDQVLISWRTIRCKTGGSETIATKQRWER